jgi:hypothetical protein
MDLSHRLELGEAKHTVFCCVAACEEGRDVDYLLMAKLDAIRTLGNPPRPGEWKIFLLLFAGRKVVLSEGHDFFVVTGKEANVSERM